VEDEVEWVMDICDSRTDTGTTIADWTTPGKSQCVMTRTSPVRIHDLDAHHTHDGFFDAEHEYACVRCSEAGQLCIEMRDERIPTVLPLHPSRREDVQGVEDMAYWVSRRSADE